MRFTFHVLACPCLLFAVYRLLVVKTFYGYYTRLCWGKFGGLPFPGKCEGNLYDFSKTVQSSFRAKREISAPHERDP